MNFVERREAGPRFQAGIVLAIAIAIALTAPAAYAQAPSAETVKRGEYLVHFGGCNDCHTPFKMGPKGPEPDMSLMLSGHPASIPIPPAPAPQGAWIWYGMGTNTVFAGPWGISVAPNLTPHETGVVGTEERFIRTLRSGKHLGGGRDILPPMPWPSAAGLTDADIKALYAYLRSIKPINNKAPESMPSGPPPAASSGR